MAFLADYKDTAISKTCFKNLFANFQKLQAIGKIIFENIKFSVYKFLVVRKIIARFFLVAQENRRK